MSLLEFDTFFNKITENQGDERDMNRIKEAFQYADNHHSGQRRKFSDFPYIIHPIRVAVKLKEFSDDVVIAGLLHDVVEDTEATQEDIRNRFGDHVSQLVYGMTKHPETKDIFQRLEQVAEKDPEVIAIKLADRLDNMTDNVEMLPEKSIKKYIYQTPKLIKMARKHDINQFVQRLQNRLDQLDEYLNTL